MNFQQLNALIRELSKIEDLTLELFTQLHEKGLMDLYRDHCEINNRLADLIMKLRYKSEIEFELNEGE